MYYSQGSTAKQLRMAKHSQSMLKSTQACVTQAATAESKNGRLNSRTCRDNNSMVSID